MERISRSPEVELLYRAWEAMTRGDLGVLEQALAPQARWRAVKDGPWNCENREAILDVIGRNLATGLRGRIEETTQTGPRLLVAFGPEQPRGDDRPLEDGIAYVVVTFEQEKIVELKGCADRAGALAYIQTEKAPGNPTAEESQGTRPAQVLADPPEQRVSRLVPLVHVGDVERSVAFYEHLGFLATSVFEYRDRLTWAALKSDAAELMVTLDGDVTDPQRQGVLFYLYSHDLAALREQLISRDIQASEIVHGTPGPSEEMRVLDPDGYVLMIAQIDLCE